MTEFVSFENLYHRLDVFFHRCEEPSRFEVLWLFRDERELNKWFNPNSEIFHNTFTIRYQEAIDIQSAYLFGTPVHGCFKTLPNYSDYLVGGNIVSRMWPNTTIDIQPINRISDYKKLYQYDLVIVSEALSDVPLIELINHNSEYEEDKEIAAEIKSFMDQYTTKEGDERSTTYD